MSGVIYRLANMGQLLELRESSYDSESVLQGLLADHPDLLAGDQMGSGERRWLLITREMGIADSEDGPNRWSIDHFFLDQDGLPTFVEVKRASDTRIRREVVAQMLEYAANAARAWNVDRIRAEFEQRCAESNLVAETQIHECCGLPSEDFWNRVETHFQAEKFRLVFVADQIPDELATLIEFLGRHMPRIEVFGVEVKLFEGDGQRTLVPSVRAGTMDRVKRGSGQRVPSPRIPITEQEYLNDFSDQSVEWTSTANSLISWARSQTAMGMSFNRGARGSTFIPYRQYGSRYACPLSLSTTGVAYIQTIFLRNYPPFDSEFTRKTLIEKLTSLGTAFEPGNKPLAGYPRILLSALAPETVSELCTILAWVFDSIEASSVRLEQESDRGVG